MAPRPISRDLAQVTIAAVEDALRNGHKPLGHSLGRHEVGCTSAAARKLETSHSVVTNRLMQAKKLYNLEPDYSLYKPKETEALRNGGVAPVLPEGFGLKRVSTLLGPDGEIKGQWVRTEAEKAQDLVAALKTAFDEYKGHAKPVPPPKDANADLLTVYPLGDYHLGMYAWGDETGEDWDLSIAERTLRATMADLVAGAQHSETAIVLSLGDFFHMDDSNNRTPASGHALDVDTRRAKVLQVGVKLLIDCVELALAKHKKVIVRCLAGNHDPATTPALSIALWAFFHNDKRVEVDCSPSKFFYHQFGNVMLASTHGDQCKPSDMPGVMAANKPAMWGETRFRYCYTGHVHHRAQICKEINGVVCESFQVLPPTDAWHAGMGYGAGRSMQAITHHRETGEKFRHIVSIVPNR